MHNSKKTNKKNPKKTQGILGMQGSIPINYSTTLSYSACELDNQMS